MKPPRLVPGGAGLISTAHDFLRYTLLLLNQHALENTNITADGTARLAVGDINPPGIALPSEAAGAGTRALLLNPLTPAGTVGGGGPAGTLFWIDQKRRGAIVFMAQVISPFLRRLFAALEQDLNCQFPRFFGKNRSCGNDVD